MRATKTIVVTAHATYGSNMAEPNTEPMTEQLTQLLPYLDEFPTLLGSVPTCDGGTITIIKSTGPSNNDQQLEKGPAPPTVSTPDMTTCTQTDEITPASTSSAQTPPSSVEIADIMEGHIKFASEDAEQRPPSLEATQARKTARAVKPRIRLIETSNVTTATKDNPLAVLHDFQYYHALLTNSVQPDLTVPSNFKAATNADNLEKWNPAIDKEIAKFTKTNTFEEITDSTLLQGKRLLFAKWLLKLDTVTFEPKARLVRRA